MKQPISQCPNCLCVTKTINNLCGKCRKPKQTDEEKLIIIKTEFFGKGYYEGLKACPASYQAGREDMRKEVNNNIGFLRQWLNELPKGHFVTSWEITQWLFPEKKINRAQKRLLSKPKVIKDPKSDVFIEFMESQGIKFVDTSTKTVRQSRGKILPFQKKLIKKHAGKPLIV